MTVKISANLSDEVIEDLKELADRRGVTMTDVLRQALATEKFLADEQRKGSKILIETADEKIKEIVFR